MSSRGSKIVNGHVTTTEYKMKTPDSYVFDAKILIGTSKKIHGLPDYSHTPNSKYIKENPDGSFREMRIYGNNGEPLLEIGYHGEKRLTGDRSKKVLHYHTLKAVTTKNIVRAPAVRLYEDSIIYIVYKKYLERYGL